MNLVPSVLHPQSGAAPVATQGRLCRNAIGAVLVLAGVCAGGAAAAAVTVATNVPTPATMAAVNLTPGVRGNAEGPAKGGGEGAAEGSFEGKDSWLALSLGTVGALLLMARRRMR